MSALHQWTTFQLLASKFLSSRYKDVYMGLNIFFNLCVYVCACMSLCVSCAQVPAEGQRAWNPLELESQAVMSCLVGAGL